MHGAGTSSLHSIFQLQRAPSPRCPDGKLIGTCNTETAECAQAPTVQVHRRRRPRENAGWKFFAHVGHGVLPPLKPNLTLFFHASLL